MSPSSLFDIDLATKYGIEEALLITHFCTSIAINKRLKKNFIEGKTWTDQTLEEIAAHFPYFNQAKVNDIVERLCTGRKRQSKKKEVDFEPILLKRNFNKDPWDKTCWYAFANTEETESHEEVRFKSQENILCISPQAREDFLAIPGMTIELIRWLTARYSDKQIHSARLATEKAKPAVPVVFFKHALKIGEIYE